MTIPTWRPETPCKRCRIAERERGSYCRPCHNALKRESDHRIRAGLERRRCDREGAPDCSTPPPPPPGFDVRDFALGRPWG